MKKLTATFFTLALALSSSMAAAEGVYLTGNLVAVNLEDSDITASDDHYDKLSFDYGGGLALAVGYATEAGFRVEGEIAGRYNEMDKLRNEYGRQLIEDGYFSALSLMANAFYTILPRHPVSPFIGAGVGLANITADFDYDDDDDEDEDYYDNDADDDDEDDDSESDTVMAFQVAAGVTYAVNEHLNIDVQYRYFATEDPDFDDVEMEYASHNGMLGLRYTF